MSEEIKTIKKSINAVQIVGTLLEKNIQIVTKEIEVIDYAHDNKRQKITCEVAEKPNFQEPSLLIEVAPKDEDGNVLYTTQVKVDFANIDFGVPSKAFGEDGKLTAENKNFKEIETVLNTYIAKKDAKVGEEPTRVFIKKGYINPNEYPDKKNDFKYKITNPNIRTYNITSSNVPSEDTCLGELSGIIRTMTPEVFIKNGEEEETGRLKVDFYWFNSKGLTFPINFIVDKDLSKAFTDNYENGQSVTLYYNIINHHIGNVKVKGRERAFGQDVEINNGYDIPEFVVISGDYPYEEDDEYYVSMELMKSAMTDRQNYIDTRIQKAKEKEEKNGTKSTVKSGLRNNPNFETLSETDEDELPF